jgi:hypothetical protein
MGLSNANPFAGYEIAKKLKECVMTYLETTSSGVPARSCVHIGEIAWDDCECGQLIVGGVDGGEITSFPDQQETRGRRGCGPNMFSWNYDIVILRCAPETSDDEPPACEDLDDAAKVAYEDAWAVRAGVICCLNELIKVKLPNGTTWIQDYTISRQTFVGPRGRCQGSSLPVTIVMKNGCYPCIDS